MHRHHIPHNQCLGFTLIWLKPTNITQACGTTSKLVPKPKRFSPNKLFAFMTTKVRNHRLVKAEVCFVWYKQHASLFWIKIFLNKVRRGTQRIRQIIYCFSFFINRVLIRNRSCCIFRRSYDNCICFYVIICLQQVSYFCRVNVLCNLRLKSGEN